MMKPWFPLVALVLAGCQITGPSSLLRGGAAPTPAYPAECGVNDRDRRIVMADVMAEDPSAGQFPLYYQVNPDVSPDRPTVFLMVDGQSVASVTGDDGFGHEAQGIVDRLAQRHHVRLNFVIMDHRGDACSPLPRAGAPSPSDDRPGAGLGIDEAMRLYDSANVVHDWETVRQDLVRRGDLRADDKVNLYGKSGAGVLAHQYVAQYPTRVARVLVQGTTDNAARSHAASRTMALARLKAHADLWAAYRRILGGDVPGVEPDAFLYVLSTDMRRNEPARGSAETLIRDVAAGRLDAYDELYESLFGARPASQASPYRAFVEAVAERTPWAAVRILELSPPPPPSPMERVPRDGDFLLAGPFARAVMAGTLRPRLVDVSRRLARVEAEELLIAGAWDNVFPLDEMKATARDLPHARVITVTAGHRLPHDEANPRQPVPYVNHCLDHVMATFFTEGLGSPRLADAPVRAAGCR